MADGAVGDIDMDVAATEGSVAILGAAGGDLGQAWSTAAGLLAEAGSRLGGGPMGQRFAAAYRPADAELRGEAGAAVAETVRLAEAGRRCVTLYADGDALAGAEFGRVRHDS